MLVFKKRVIMAVGFAIAASLFIIGVSASSDVVVSNEGFLRPQKLCDGEPCEAHHSSVDIVPGSVKAEGDEPKGGSINVPAFARIDAPAFAKAVEAVVTPEQPVAEKQSSTELTFIGIFSLVTAENANGMILEESSPAVLDKNVKSEKMKKKMPEIKTFGILDRYLVKVSLRSNGLYKLEKQWPATSEWFTLAVLRVESAPSVWDIVAVGDVTPEDVEENFDITALTPDIFGAVPVMISVKLGEVPVMLHLEDPSSVVGSARMVPQDTAKHNNRFYIVEHNKYAEMSDINISDTYWFINKLEGKCLNPFGANDQKDAGCTMLFADNTRMKPIMVANGAKFELVTESATYQQLALERNYIDGRLRTTVSSDGRDPGDLLIGFAHQPVANFYLKDLCKGWTPIQTNDKLLLNKYAHLVSVKGEVDNEYVSWQVARIYHNTPQLLLVS